MEAKMDELTKAIKMFMNREGGSTSLVEKLVLTVACMVIILMLA